MPISWLTVLKSVPWSEVIANAPKVAEGAKKLWSTVSRRDGPVDVVARDAAQPGAVPADAAALRAQIVTLERAVTELHEQMRASSELIKALAEQNALLVARIDANRRRMIWVGVIALIALVLSLVVALPARA